MSSINPNNINGQYPVAGQDNDSQGFRDNFTNIKNNFTFAKTELEDLQSKVIVTSALDGFELNNDLNNTLLKGAQLIETTETIKDLGPSGADITVNWTEGHFQIFELTDNADVTFANWPESGYYTKLRLMVNVTDVANFHTIYLTNILDWVGLNNVLGGSTFDNSITFTQDGRYVYELSRYNTSAIFIEEICNEPVDSPPVQYLPQVIAANVGIKLTDAGKHYYQPNATPTTITVSSNANVPYPIGTQITVVNGNTSPITLARAQYPSNTAANISVVGSSFTYVSGNILTVASNVGLVVGMAVNTGFPIGTTITVVHIGNSNVIMSANATSTISNTALSFGNLSTVDVYLAGNATVSNRTIGAYGSATLLKVKTNTWHVTGANIA